MKSNKSAVRYAKALLELAIEHNKVELIESDIQKLLTVANDAHDFQIFLNSPLINIDKKIAVIKEIFKDFNQTTLDFLALVTNNGRETVMLDIAKQFIAQLKSHRGIVPITIISAQKLEDATKQAIISKISAAISGTPEISEEIDAALIGGFVVRMGDHQIDASVASQLQRMKQQLV
ncbi:MAG: ATP synthase F1 subunit delta [Flavobacteriales bacterium]